MKQFLFAVVMILSFWSCSSQIRENSKSNSQPISHDLWDKVLREYVSPEGLVDYKMLLEKREGFDNYINLLKSSHPNDANWSKQEQIVYWINAYNAFTVELILQNYPVKSILEIGGLIKIPGIESAWDVQFIKIEDKEYTLGEIEHEKLREQFYEPRIHFAIACASISCPNLLNEAYRVEMINAQLESQANLFINDSSKNQISEKAVRLSRIFDWYKDDFVVNMTLITHINRYSKIKISKDVKMGYLDYDWGLNEQKHK
ncbi:DUF547 domain-containing protein [bacterium AH-315-C07]|nr:DUF547 domain-containing protein [bacterium AH-315-C07]